MFGGIAALGSDRLVFATFDGHVLTLDLDSGDLLGHRALYPVAPRQVHIAACAVDLNGSLLLADARHGRVRVLDPDGIQRRRLGGLATPGADHEDIAGILHEPCALLVLEEGVWVASAGDGLEHAVQCFDPDGRYRFSGRNPEGEWRGASGLVRVGGEVWVAETDANRIRRCDLLDGRALGSVELDPDLVRPFRLAPDAHDGVLALFAPPVEEDGVESALPPAGIARLDRDGAFEEWAVLPGEESGKVNAPFDVAPLPDGRFAVADLPLGEPPDVRIQLFSPDGRLLGVPVADSDELGRIQRAWFEARIERIDGSAPALHEAARVHHYHGGQTRDHFEEAARLYRAALAEDPAHLLARLALADLLLEAFEDPEGAEAEYREALAAGVAEAEILARIAECRHERGDLDQAIRILQQAVESGDQPEDYHRRVEILGSWFLERAGEDPELLL